MVTLAAPLPPCCTLTFGVETLIVNPPAARMVSDSVSVSSMFPVPRPRTVKVYVPGIVVIATEISKVELVLPAEMVAGVYVGVTPSGAFSTVTFTSPAYPFMRATVVVTVPISPCLTVRLAADNETVMAAAGGVTPPFPSPPPPWQPTPSTARPIATPSDQRLCERIRAFLFQKCLMPRERVSRVIIKVF